MSLHDLAQSLDVSPHALHRLFKKHLGISPKGFATALRAERLRESLRESPSVTAALAQAGYPTSSRAYVELGEQIGMTPGEYRRGAPDMSIRYAITSCSLGSLLVAATERGICMIELADDAESLEQTAQERFPKAELNADDPAFTQLVCQTVEIIESSASPSAIPLDLRGTAFQRRVWEALRCLPLGTTTTYSELAKQIGQPTAARAVASACAANPIAILIPCHRVLRKDGKISGYRWGRDRKVRILEREGIAIAERATNSEGS